MRPMSAIWLLMRSHSAIPYLLAVTVITVVACLLGPDSRTVITRDGAIGVPLPFVLALIGVATMVCLGDPEPELTSTMPRPAWQPRTAIFLFVVLVSWASVTVSSVVAPGLTAASARNVLVALAVAFTAALWRPLLSWVPTTMYLALSWFYGTPTYGGSARAWAIPAQPPDWSGTLVWGCIALVTAGAWVTRRR